MSALTRLAALLILLLPAPAAAQGILDEFSYEGLRFSGIGVDIGAVLPDRLETEVSGSLRVDYGFIAPRVRTLFGVSYFRSRFNQTEIDEFEQRLRGVVVPQGPFSIEVGTVEWTDVALELDLQYLLSRSQSVVPYAGIGLGVHIRNADGAAIEGTFVEDALETVAAALNVSLGLELRLVDRLRLTTDLRGLLSSGLLAGAVRAGLMYRVPHGSE